MCFLKRDFMYFLKRDLMPQARESHNGINGPILEAETEIRGYFSFLRVFLNFDFFVSFYSFLCLMCSYQVEEHSIQQWLEARDRIGFGISFPFLLVLNSTSFCLRPAVLLPDPTVQQTTAQPTASKVAKSLYPLLAKLTGMYFY